MGIGTNSPSFKLDVAGTMGVQSSFNLTAPASAAQLNVTAYTNGSVGPYLWLTRARGTQSTPSSVLINDMLGGIYFVGRGGSGNDDGSSIIGYAAEDWGTSNKGSYIQFNTATNTTTTPLTRMHIDHKGNIGIGDNTPDYLLDLEENTTEFLLNIHTLGTLASNLVRFERNGAPVGTITVDFVGSVSYNAFTGGHYGTTSEIPELYHLLSTTGKYQTLTEMGEPYYDLVTTCQSNDPNVIGAMGHEIHESDVKKKIGGHVVVVSAVGNGKMWVMSNGHDLKSGDYLISSEVSGHAMLESGQFELANVIARVTEPIIWSEISKIVNGQKHVLVNITFENFVKNNKTDRLEIDIENLKREVQEIKELLNLKTSNQ